MKPGWKTRAIGRHLVDVPGDAKLIESYEFNKVKIEPLPEIKTQARFDLLVSEREKELRAAKHKTKDSMFVERVPHANGSVTLISWSLPSWVEGYTFDTYFRVGAKALRYSGEVSADRRQPAIDRRSHYAREWRELKPDEIPEGIGFVVDGAILMDKDFNRESWTLALKFAGKPDVFFDVSAFAMKKVEEPLRKRTAEVHAGLLARIVGLGHLRNRERPVGPIWGEEILTAGTANGKRLYAFKWEAPGKAWSLAEPQIGVELGVIESAYETNKESFANDDEALELWDAIVDSIRLRPGAA